MRLVSPIIKRWTLQVMHILRMHGRDATRMSRDWPRQKMKCFIWLWILESLKHTCPRARVKKTIL